MKLQGVKAAYEISLVRAGKEKSRKQTRAEVRYLLSVDCQIRCAFLFEGCVSGGQYGEDFAKSCCPNFPTAERDIICPVGLNYSGIAF